MQNESILTSTTEARAFRDHQFFHGDCLEIMKKLPSQSIDLVLCDLPYGTTQNKWDAVIPLGPLWAEYRRLCKGVILLTAAQPFTSQLITAAFDLFRYEWIWVKNKASGHLNAKKRPMTAHESILVFSKETPPYSPQMSEGHRPANYAKRVGWTTNYGDQKETTYAGGNTDRYPTSVLPFAVVNNDSPDRCHPTQKPVPLMEYLIRTYSQPGDVVLDNCMGSGTTGIACLITGRRFVGIEKDAAYFNAACRRIASTNEEPFIETVKREEAEPDLFSFTAA